MRSTFHITISMCVNMCMCAPVREFYSGGNFQVSIFGIMQKSPMDGICDYANQGTDKRWKDHDIKGST